MFSTVLIINNGVRLIRCPLNTGFTNRPNVHQVVPRCYRCFEQSTIAQQHCYCNRIIQHYVVLRTCNYNYKRSAENHKN